MFDQSSDNAFTCIAMLQKEKQQCLEYLAEHVVKLHASQGLQLSAATGAPKWITVGVKMLWKAFEDGASNNEQLSVQASDSLKVNMSVLEMRSEFLDFCNIING